MPGATCFTSPMKGSSAAALDCEIIKEKLEVGKPKNTHMPLLADVRASSQILSC